MDLEEFAPKSRTQCVVCNLPDELRSQVEAGRTSDPKRFTYSVISKWLKTNWALDCSEDSLRRHFNRGHA